MLDDCHLCYSIGKSKEFYDLSCCCLEDDNAYCLGRSFEECPSLTSCCDLIRFSLLCYFDTHTRKKRCSHRCH